MVAKPTEPTSLADAFSLAGLALDQVVPIVAAICRQQRGENPIGTTPMVAATQAGRYLKSLAPSPDVTVVAVLLLGEAQRILHAILVDASTWHVDDDLEELEQLDELEREPKERNRE